MQFDASKQNVDSCDGNNNLINQAQGDIIISTYNLIFQEGAKREATQILYDLNITPDIQEELSKPYKYKLFLEFVKTVTTLPDNTYKNIVKELLLQELKRILSDKSENRYILQDTAIQTFQKLNIEQLKLLVGIILIKGVKSLCDSSNNLDEYLSIHLRPFILEEIQEIDLFMLHQTNCLQTLSAGFFYPLPLYKMYNYFPSDFLFNIPQDLVNKKFQQLIKLNPSILDILFSYNPHSALFDFKIKRISELNNMLNRQNITNEKTLLDISSALYGLFQANIKNAFEKAENPPERSYLIKLGDYNEKITPLGMVIGLLYFEHITGIKIESEYIHL